MKELIIRKKIVELEDALVQRAEKAVDDCEGITDKLQDKQIRNVIAVADETESLSIVDNFIKYQIGRCKENEGWRFGERSRAFGEAVREHLKWLREQAKLKQGDGVTAKDLEIRLVRLFLGYLMRHFKYVDAMQKAEKVQKSQGGES